MATLQVKGMDDRLYRALQTKARMDNRSVSQEVISLIQDHLSSTAPAKAEAATEKFLRLCGAWADDRPAETIVAEIRKSRVKRERSRNHVFD